MIVTAAAEKTRIPHRAKRRKYLSVVRVVPHLDLADQQRIMLAENPHGSTNHLQFVTFHVNFDDINASSRAQRLAQVRVERHLIDSSHTRVCRLDYRIADAQTGRTKVCNGVPAHEKA